MRRTLGSRESSKYAARHARSSSPCMTVIFRSELDGAQSATSSRGVDAEAPRRAGVCERTTKGSAFCAARWHVLKSRLGGRERRTTFFRRYLTQVVLQQRVAKLVERSNTAE